MEALMSSRTIYLARLLGSYCVLVALSMLLHKQATVDLVTALLHSEPFLFTMGLVAVATGLAIVLGHNVWSGSAPAVVVTLTGWLTLAKGAMFLFLSSGAEAGFILGTLHYEQFFYIYSSISLVLGVYLTVAGFRRRDPVAVTERTEVTPTSEPITHRR
jgi:hypothetical protein